MMSWLMESLVELISKTFLLSKFIAKLHKFDTYDVISFNCTKRKSIHVICSHFVIQQYNEICLPINLQKIYSQFHFEWGKSNVKLFIC